MDRLTKLFAAVLESYDGMCLDNEGERLVVAQALARQFSGAGSAKWAQTPSPLRTQVIELMQMEADGGPGSWVENGDDAMEKAIHAAITVLMEADPDAATKP